MCMCAVRKDCMNVSSNNTCQVEDRFQGWTIILAIYSKSAGSIACRWISIIKWFNYCSQAKHFEEKSILLLHRHPARVSNFSRKPFLCLPSITNFLSFFIIIYVDAKKKICKKLNSSNQKKTVGVAAAMRWIMLPFHLGIENL